MNKVDKGLVGLIAVFVLSFIVFVSMVVFRDQILVFTRATADTTPSASETKIFAWPLDLSIGEKSTISVFVVSENGKKLSNKTVTLQSTHGIIQSPTVVSDDTGKAVFVLEADEPGKAEVSAQIDNTVQVNQKVSILFK